MWRAARENIRLSWKPNLVAAVPAALVVTLLCSWTVTAKLDFSGHLVLTFLHFILAYALLEFLWLPQTWLRRRFLQPGAALFFVIVMSILLAAAFGLIFPYNLFNKLFDIKLIQWRMAEVVFGAHLLFGFSLLKCLRNLSFWAVIRHLKDRWFHRQNRRVALDRQFHPRWFLNAVGFIFGLYFIVIFEWWIVNLNVTVISDEAIHFRLVPEKVAAFFAPEPQNFLALPKFLQPYQAVVKPHADEIDSPVTNPSKQIREQAGRLLPVISITLSGVFWLFLWGIVPVLLMSFILPAVQHNETTYCQRLIHAPTYAGQFYLAIFAAYPLFSITSLVVLIFLIMIPLIFALGNHSDWLQALIGPDEILFIFTLLAAWISPIVYAGVNVDRTFGAYFNAKLSNLILGVRDHVVVLGFGDLGQRVVKRELAKLDRRQRRVGRWHQRLRVWPFVHQPESEWLEKVVSPDLQVEYLCTKFILVDRNTENFLFAANNDVLGAFGVVGALEKSTAPKDSAAHSERRRVLVPIVQGDATEPSTLSRVNLERASFLISTVSQDERIRDIFSRAVDAGLRAIICVSRSNQIVNLTHKAPRQPITLVYPKQNSGVTLGQRLITAALKIRPTLPHGQTAPRLMVIGMNKSNHFMLEMFWHNLTAMNDAQRAEFFSENFRFVITGKADIYTAPRFATAEPAATASCFGRIWRSSYVTGFRHFPATGLEPALTFAVPTCVMQADETNVLERCYHEFRPDIVVINDDEVEKSRMLLLWSVNCLERLKYASPNFRLPLLLMSAARGDETERKDIGDVFQFYESLTRLYKDDRGPGYPRHAYFRRELPRRLIGDSVQDALADTEEIISGIRDNWELAASRSAAKQSEPKTATAKRGDAFELNTCLPDTVGSLARLTARLAGLEFARVPQELLTDFFSRRNDAAPPAILRPSFQYMRHLKLDVDGRGFCLTGFADLHENTPDEIAAENFAEDEAVAMRAYAKDIHDYIDCQPDDPAIKNLPAPRLLALTTGAAFQSLDTQTFIDVMMGAPPHDTEGAASSLHVGETFCPGMTSCPIASYQHSIVANNAKEFAAWRLEKKNPPLRKAPNYGCARLPLRKETANAAPRYARIFYCCHNERNTPGLLAVALNLLNFQRFARLARREERERNRDHDWIVNVEYFKDSSCHNRLFSLNRLFGTRCYTKDLLREFNWTLPEYEEQWRQAMPFSLLQIMPVGGAEIARQWFDYALALYRFLSAIESNRFCFQWWDQQENYQDKHELAFEGGEYPIAIQINKLLNWKQSGEKEKKDRCEFCGVKDPEMTRGCAQRRPWLDPE